MGVALLVQGSTRVERSGGAGKLASRGRKNRVPQRAAGEGGGKGAQGRPLETWERSHKGWDSWSCLGRIWGAVRTGLAAEVGGAGRLGAPGAGPGRSYNGIRRERPDRRRGPGGVKGRDGEQKAPRLARGVHCSPWWRVSRLAECFSVYLCQVVFVGLRLSCWGSLGQEAFPPESSGCATLTVCSRS